MTHKIKVLTLAYLLSTVALVFSFFITPAYLPTELQAYLESQLIGYISNIELVGACVFLIIAFVHLVSAIFLVAVKAWARKTFLISTFLLFLYLPFAGPSVDHAITYTINDLSMLLLGMVVGLLLFTSDYQEFALNKLHQRIP